MPSFDIWQYSARFLVDPDPAVMNRFQFNLWELNTMWHVLFRRLGTSGSIATVPTVAAVHVTFILGGPW